MSRTPWQDLHVQYHYINRPPGMRRTEPQSPLEKTELTVQRWQALPTLYYSLPLQQGKVNGKPAEQNMLAQALFVRESQMHSTRTQRTSEGSPEKAIRVDLQYQDSPSRAHKQPWPDFISATVPSRK